MIHLNDLEAMERKAKENEGLYIREKNSNQELRSKLSSTAS